MLTIRKMNNPNPLPRRSFCALLLALFVPIKREHAEFYENEWIEARWRLWAVRERALELMKSNKIYAKYSAEMMQKILRNGP